MATRPILTELLQKTPRHTEKEWIKKNNELTMVTLVNTCSVSVYVCMQTAEEIGNKQIHQNHRTV